MRILFLGGPRHNEYRDIPFDIEGKTEPPSFIVVRHIEPGQLYHNEFGKDLHMYQRYKVVEGPMLAEAPVREQWVYGRTQADVDAYCERLNEERRQR